MAADDTNAAATDSPVYRVTIRPMVRPIVAA
jgi:hypothetical protein